jgi:hypothetical protein
MLSSMKKMSRRTPALSQLERQYARWRAKLGGLGYLSQGSVQDRTARIGGGAGYQWTRKLKGKTVSVALTREQFQAMKKAVKNKRELLVIVNQLEKLSRQILFQTYPHSARRKSLSNEVLGLN